MKWEVKDTVSQAGKETYRIEVGTPYRNFTVWISKEPRHPQAFHQLQLLEALSGERPTSVKYVKEQSGFFRIIGFNLPIDVNEADQSYLKFVS